MKGYLLIIGTLIVIISVLITLNVFFQQSLQMEMAEQFNKQQFLLSKSIADNIKTYFYHLEEEVLLALNVLSKTDFKSGEDFNRITNKILKEEELIKTNLGMLSPEGDIIFFKGEENNLLKTVVPKIIQQAKITLQNRTSIIETRGMLHVISPIYGEGNIKRIFFMSIKIQDIATHFLSNIKSGNRGYAWMMDKDGTLLYHPMQPGMVGGNIFRAEKDCFKCHLSFDLEKRIIEGKAGNYGRYIAPTGEDKIIAFSFADTGSLSWIIAVSAPYSEVTQVTGQSMKLYSYLIIAIFTTTTMVSALLIVINKKRIKAEEMAKRKEELEKYAHMLESKVRERTAEVSSEKEKLNTIVSTIGGGILLLGNDGKIQWSNEKLREMVGHDVVGMGCEDLCTDCSVISDSHSKGVDTTIIADLFEQKGKYFQVTNAPIKGADGEIHGYIRLIQDITEMKKMEEQIVHSEKLASIGRLAAGIAHEIGNPLTSIFSFVQILREMELDEFRKESLETIYFHVNRISDILKQLSGFSKMPAGEVKKCHVNEIIETSINLIQYDKKAKNISIVKELSSSLPEVVIDGNQLSQVVVNLTLNAIDAMPDGGTLTIRSKANVNTVSVLFEDTGTGIPKEDLTKIFDPFYTTKEKGTGLGLAVSYDIIKKMSGTLGIESEVGKGSIFTITLPV